MKAARLALPAGTLLLAAAHLAVGRGVDLPAVLSGAADDTSWRILLQLRLPRTVVAALAGASLGVSGLLLQAVLRNPLASPELTAINPAAVLALLGAIAAGLDASQVLPAAGVAMLGGAAGGALMWLLARGRSAGETAVLGLLAALALTGASTLILAARPTGLSGVLRWLVGSLEGSVAEGAAALLPLVAVGLALAVAAAAPLDLLAVSDAHAHALGVPPGLWRGVGLALATLLAGAAVAVVGPLAFVGFLAPHLTRAWAPSRLAVAVPLVAAVGAAFVLACDTAATAITLLIQQAGAGQQVGVPAGSVTCLLGAAALVAVAGRAQEGDLE